MKKRSSVFLLLALIWLAPDVSALNQTSPLNQPPPPAIRKSVDRAVRLAEQDKPWAAIALLKKVFARSPNYLRAHVEYLNIKADFLGRTDEAEAEYRSLIRRFPRNPVYPMAFYLRTNGIYGQSDLHKVVNLAPNWAWGHYAQALLLRAKDPETAVIELQRCIEKDGSALAAYEALIQLQETQLNKIDDAIRTAEQLAASDIRPQRRLMPLWRLRLTKLKTEEGKQALAIELQHLEDSKDVEMLLALRKAYLNLLKSPERAAIIERRIKALDPSWTSDRGWVYSVMTRNQSQVPRRVVMVNRQIALWRKVSETARATELTRDERIILLKKLLSQRPDAEVARKIHEEIFNLAVRAGNALEARRSGLRLHAIDPEDSMVTSQLALVLAEKRIHLSEAMSLARRAERRTATFRPARRPPNTSQQWLDFLFPDQKQREQFRKNRASALDALGWSLAQSHQFRQAEPWLRQAVELERSEVSLWHLAKVLERTGKRDEAALLEEEANSFLAKTVTKKFSDEALPDVRLQSLDGRNFKLSDFKGKVVVIEFWATWCGPCIEQFPFLKKLFTKYKEQGLEVVAVSIDEDAQKVAPFAAEKKLNFLVTHSPGIANQFNARTIPNTLFIDRRGKLRYRKVGFAEGEEREVEVIIMELLKRSIE